MKIGTVTFSESKENYGQILQGYALVKFLREIGHESFLIRVRHQYIDDRSITRKILDKMKILFSMRSVSVIKEKVVQKRQHKNMVDSTTEHPRHFERFIEQNIPCTPIWYNDNTMMENPPSADAYICGSDQIWGADLPFMYLAFARNKLKLSYAASFGGVVPDTDTLNKIKEYLRSFSWISLRETSGLNICKQLGYNSATVVPDPTLLLSATTYKNLYTNSNRENHSKAYLLLYLLGNRISVRVNEIMQFAKRHGLEVKYVTAHGRIDKYNKIYPTIEDWLNLIANAECVITNSYHGTIFSIIFHRKFLTLPIVGIRSRMNTRLEELLNRYNLTDRLYRDSLSASLMNVDFTTFDKVSSNDIKKVKETLMSILN